METADWSYVTCRSLSANERSLRIRLSQLTFLTETKVEKAQRKFFLNLATFQTIIEEKCNFLD
jgi:hypothetical protein